MPLPQVLKNFNLFVDGRGYAGRAEEVNLPKITVKTEEFRAGGMDSPVELDMGTDKLECSFSLSEYNQEVLTLWGIVVDADTPFVFRGAVQRQGEDAEPVIAKVRGRIKEFDPGAWKAGDKAVAKLTVAVTYYQLTVNGAVAVEIDVENMIRITDGSDQMASLRTALGI